MKKLVTTLVILVVASMVCANIPSTDVAWSNQYMGNVMPDEDIPAWTVSTDGWGYFNPPDRDITCDGDILEWHTDVITAKHYWQQSWSPEMVATVEVRLKATASVDVAGKAAQLYMGLGRAGAVSNPGLDRRFEFNWGPNGIWAGDKTYLVDLSSEFRTFRILLFGETSQFPVGYMEVYDLNSATPDIPVCQTGLATSMWSGGKFIQFGDIFSGSIGGAAQLDYLVWTNSGTFVPVPEPMTMTLLGFGALVFLKRK